jgi:inosine-uridine nucleoside N-ribohydrolase
MTTRGTVALATASLLAFLTASCDGQPRTPPEHPTPDTVRVVVDTDMGTDDVMALLFLLERPDVTVTAVTIAGDGLSHCDAGVENARALLTLAGVPGVPVACGRTSPLAGDNAFPEEWRAFSDDLSTIPNLPDAAGVPYEGGAVDLLLESLDRDTTLLTLGPMTNVAEALRKDPEIGDRVGRVVSMAGAIDVAGNAPNTVAEFNVWIDALAAKEVADSVPVEFVPLDASNFAPVTPFFVDALGRHLDSPVARAIHALLVNNPQVETGTYYFWDPLAAALLVDPGLATWDEDRLLITASLDAGAGWISRWDGGIPARFAVRADAVHFEHVFLRTITGHPVTRLRPRPDVDVSFDGRGCRMGTRRLHAGDIVIRFTNRSADTASVIVLSFPGTTYGQVIRFVGPPGSTVAEPPAGVEEVSVLRAGPHQRMFGRAAVAAGDGGVFCLVESSEGTAKVWPAGRLRPTG